MSSVPISAKEPGKDSVNVKERLSKSTGEPRYAVLNINNITTWMRSDGQSNHSPWGDDGMYYPRGTGSAIYQDGLVWGGKVFTNAAMTAPAPRQAIRVGGGTYDIGTRAGRIIGSIATATAVSPNDPDVRTFRIRRDFATMSVWDLRRDAASVNETSEYAVTYTQQEAVRAQYAKDWTEWPVAYGAPFIDRNSNGIYDAPPPFNLDTNLGPTFTADSLIAQGRDEPGVSGSDPNLPADQVIWSVYNDLDVTQAQTFEGSEPMGLEVQRTTWGYNRTGALGDIYFTRYRLINKGGVDVDVAAGNQTGAFWIDSMYVGQWSDPDIGNAGDDLVGCDSIMSLGYAYNGYQADLEYRIYNIPPPAIGYDFLAGPTVTSQGDSAIVNLKRRYGSRNLPMSSFAHFGGVGYSDPPRGAANYHAGSGQWWKMLRGFAPLGDFSTVDQPYEHGPWPASRFPFNGDPVNRTGFIDGLGTYYSYSPGDRRILLNTGPFRMAPGDTQEIYVGVVAGLGADNLTSVTVMKINDKAVQTAFNRLFSVPRPPAAPKVNATELDGSIVLEWGSDLSAVKATEETVIGGSYLFEGYNVYACPVGTPLDVYGINQWVKIATYDRVNGIMTISEESYDPETGLPAYRMLQKGTDAGVKRSILIDRDYAADPPPYSSERLRNGLEYTYAVTAYNVNSVRGEVPVSLESDPVIVKAKPRRPFGTQPLVARGDTLPVIHSAGTGDGQAVATIMDPLRGTGDTYRVTFQTSSVDTILWSVQNITRGTQVAAGQRLLDKAEDPPILEGGIYLRVTSPPSGLKKGAWGLGNGTSFTTGARIMSWAYGDGLQLEEFNGAVGWNAPIYYHGVSPIRPVSGTDLVGIVVKFAQHAAGTSTGNLGADLFDKTDDDSASYAYRFVRDATSAAVRPEFSPWIVNAAGGYSFQDYRISAPLAVYNTDVNPPERLAIGFLENNAINAELDGYYWPGNQGAMRGGDNNTSATGPREWLFVMKSPYTGAARNAAWLDVLNDPRIPVMYLFTWNRRNANAWVGDESVTFTANKMSSPSDVFEYTVPAPDKSRTVQLASADRVGVFPNPFYANGTYDESSSSSRYVQFVTFNNLPQRAIIRIFNLAGHQVRTLRKDAPTQFLPWDLKTEDGWLVASGMYVCHVELPDLGVSKVLKLGVIVGE